ncbi:MAG: thioesterase family protein [Pseudolabrys sp.]
MKPSLVPGLKHSFTYKVPVEKTVPYTFPEAEELQAMPEVFATGFMIILMEWTCAQLMAPHMDAGEGSLGVHVDVSHLAATLPGMAVTAEAELTTVNGRKLEFKVSAHDGIDLIGEGRHQRAVVAWDKFNARVAEKGRVAGVV